MILSISVSNYAIIEKVDIDFSGGLNILTGETGAGKSILIGALSLALGYRANTDNIRNGMDSMSVSMLFSVDLKNENIKNILNNYDVKLEDDTILISRIVHRNGRNICKINGSLVNVGALKEIGSYLVDIHGQHEHQRLLADSTHLNFLDLYSKDYTKENLYNVKMCYERYKSFLKEYNDLVAMAKENENNLYRYKEELEEISDIDLEEGLDERLEKREVILSNMQNIYEFIHSAYDTMYEKEENVISSLSDIISDVEKASGYDESISPNLQLLNECKINLEEVSYFIRDYKDSLEFSPQELEDVVTKINTIKKLKRKYGQNIREIIEYKESLSEKIFLIEDYSNKINEYKVKLDILKEEYLTQAKILSEKRKYYAKNFENSIIEKLELLAMKGSEFSVEFSLLEEGSYKNTGIDSVKFLISTNKGSELKSLSKVASGGEISRVMLAIKGILASSDEVGTLIFDEIDTGISGRTSQVVAKELFNLSKSHQIISITHLPQIASFGDSNFLIEKKIINDKTSTTFVKMDEEQKVYELARMLGGEEITDITISHAREMLDLVKKH